ncbi:hypothetical protein [Burkholderia ambifaria]|uniref:hypothetical protein n=1 Tax=Burkholderia ambifaria TaxID=152480 RepID=UPI00158DB659|nr:hypothetical protein [Burkholderia ambifaria]
MVVETSALLCMIGSSWGSGGSPSGGIALAVVPAALVSAAFLSGKPPSDAQEDRYADLDDAAALAPGGTLGCFSRRAVWRLRDVKKISGN